MRKPQSGNLTRENKHKQQQNTKTENKKLNPQNTQRLIACPQAIKIFELPIHIPTMNE